MSEYKRWEKAAIAGVSLVADAAVHLERTSNGFPSDRLLDGLHSMTFSSSEGKLLNKMSYFGYNGKLWSDFCVMLLRKQEYSSSKHRYASATLWISQNKIT